MKYFDLLLLFCLDIPSELIIVYLLSPVISKGKGKAFPLQVYGAQSVMGG
jgi:hypothetical protein